MLETHRSALRDVALFVAVTFTATPGLVLLGIHVAPVFTRLVILVPMVAALGVHRFVARRRLLGPDGLGFRRGRVSLSLLGPLAGSLFVLTSLAITLAAVPEAAVTSAELKQRVEGVDLLSSWPFEQKLAALATIEWPSRTAP